MKNSREYRETLVKTLVVIILIVLLSIFVITVSFVVTDKLNFKYPDRIAKIDKNGKTYIEWDKVMLKQYLKLLINSKDKEYYLIRDKIFSYDLKIQEENYRIKKQKNKIIKDMLNNNGIFKGEILSINVDSGKYYRNSNNVLKETIKTLRVTIKTKKDKYKDLVVELDYQNLIKSIKINANEQLNKLKILNSIYSLLSKKNLYDYFAIALRGNIKTQRIILNEKELEKVMFFIKDDKEYIIIKVDNYYRLELKDQNIISITKIKEQEDKLDYLLF